MQGLKMRTGMFGAIMAAALIIASCSSTEPSNEEGTMAMKTSITGQTVTSGMQRKGDAVQGGTTIDSIRIDSIRILISRIKLHRSEDDTANGGKDVKTGPAVIVWTQDTTRVAFETALPVGTYRKMKLEKHKFTPGQALEYATHPVFGDFAFPERITLIVDGKLYGSDGVNEFTVTDDKTENMWLMFEPDLQITGGTTTSVEWNFDAIMVFRKGGRVLDPRNIGDMGDISDGLKKCWKIFRR